jgi:hypothetical protein
MKQDITTDNKALTYSDLVCLSNILLAYSLDAELNHKVGLTRVSKYLAIKVNKLLSDMEA